VKKRLRLRRQRDFQHVLSIRRLYVGRTLVAFAVPGRGEGLRVGIAVSRQLRGAATRNRARRRLREAVRHRMFDDWAAAERGIRYDVVMIARPPALSEPLACLERDVGAVAERLVQAADRRQDQ
jgi:ribonuclease P protein component